MLRPSQCLFTLTWVQKRLRLKMLLLLFWSMLEAFFCLVHKEGKKNTPKEPRALDFRNLMVGFQMWLRVCLPANAITTWSASLLWLDTSVVSLHFQYSNTYIYMFMEVFQPLYWLFAFTCPPFLYLGKISQTCTVHRGRLEQSETLNSMPVPNLYKHAPLWGTYLLSRSKKRPAAGEKSQGGTLGSALIWPRSFLGFSFD